MLYRDEPVHDPVAEDPGWPALELPSTAHDQSVRTLAVVTGAAVLTIVMIAASTWAAVASKVTPEDLAVDLCQAEARASLNLAPDATFRNTRVESVIEKTERVIRERELDGTSLPGNWPQLRAQYRDNARDKQRQDLNDDWFTVFVSGEIVVAEAADGAPSARWLCYAAGPGGAPEYANLWEYDGDSLYAPDYGDQMRDNVVPVGWGQ